MGREKKKKKLLRERKCRLARWQVLSYKRMTTTTKKNQLNKRVMPLCTNCLWSKKKMFEMEECWFTMSPVSDAKVGRENRMWRRSSVISYVHSK